MSDNTQHTVSWSGTHPLEPLYRAALARAAALEAEAARLAGALDTVAGENAQLQELVAELEAALAAQQWRPVTEKPLSTAQNQVVVMHGNRRLMADHMAYYLESGWAGTDVVFWRPIPPLPPAPQETE